MGDRNLYCRDRNFIPFLLLWPWPWPDDLHIRTWPVLPGDTSDVQIWTSHIKAFESYRRTDIQTDKPLRVVISGHVTKTAVTPFDPPYSKTPCYMQTDGSVFYRTGVMGGRYLHCWNKHFGRFRLLWSLPWPDDLLIRTWPVLPRDNRVCKYELHTSRLSKVIVWQTDRIDRNYKPNRFAGGQKTLSAVFRWLHMFNMRKTKRDWKHNGIMWRCRVFLFKTAVNIRNSFNLHKTLVTIAFCQIVFYLSVYLSVCLSVHLSLCSARQ